MKRAIKDRLQVIVYYIFSFNGQKMIKLMPKRKNYDILLITEVNALIGSMSRNRERIYIVDFRDSNDFNKFQWPLSLPLTTMVRDIIDFESKLDDKYYYTESIREIFMNYCAKQQKMMTSRIQQFTSGE